MTFNSLNKIYKSLSGYKTEKKLVNVLLITGTFSCLLSFLLIRKVDYYLGETARIGIMTGLIVFAFLYFKKSGIRFKAVCIGFLIAVNIFLLQTTFEIIRNNLENPHEWDFLCFYMDGSVASKGLNFYEPKNYGEVYKHVNLPFKPGSEFVPETINVGFQYFPPNIFLFVLLGSFNFNTAHLIWILFNLIVTALDILLITKIFFKNDKFPGLLIVTALFLIFPGTMFTLKVEQYTSLMLLILLLIWKDQNSLRSGIWIAAGLALKPIMIIFLFYPLLLGKLKTFLTAIAASIFLFVIPLVVFGTSTFLTYFTNNPVHNLPKWVYTEWANQSLFSTLLRWNSSATVPGNPLLNPLFVFLSLLIGGISFWKILRLRKSDPEWVLPVFISAALLLYPGTIFSYSLLLIPVIFILLKYLSLQRNYFFVIILLVIYIFVNLVPFYAHFLTWLFLILVPGKEIRLIEKLKIERAKMQSSIQGETI